MHVEVIGEIKEQPDGSALIQLDMDDGFKMYLIQIGFETLILRGLEKDTLAVKQPSQEDTFKELENEKS